MCSPILTCTRSASHSAGPCRDCEVAEVVVGDVPHDAVVDDDVVYLHGESEDRIRNLRGLLDRLRARASWDGISAAISSW